MAVCLLSPVRGTPEVLGVSKRYPHRDTPERYQPLAAPQALTLIGEHGEVNAMGEISDLLQQKAGLSPDKAQEVEEVVIEYAKSKVPAEFQGMLGSVLGDGSSDGQQAQSGGLSGLLGEASSFFGNKG